MNELELPLHLNRKVQLWSYSVSHSVLLFRANKQAQIDLRLDIMFRMVRQMKIAHRYDDLHVSVLTSLEASSRFGLNHADISDRFVFGLTADGVLDSYVVAGSMYMSEDDMEDHDLSSIDERSLSSHVVRSGQYPV